MKGKKRKKSRAKTKAEIRADMEAAYQRSVERANRYRSELHDAASILQRFVDWLERVADEPPI
jgi:broad specificity phosphatase PhoE